MINKKENQQLLHEKELLKEVYKVKEEKINSLTNEEIKNLLYEKQKDDIKVKKNPNAFWVLNGMPAPDLPEPTTNKKYGAMVVIALFVVLAGFFALFMVWAFIK